MIEYLKCDNMEKSEKIKKQEDIDVKSSDSLFLVNENPHIRNAVLVFGGIIVFILTFLFRLEGYAYNHTSGLLEEVPGALDLVISGMFYDDGWYQKEVLFWEILNENDYYIIGILGIFGLVMMIVGATDKSRRPWLRYGFFMVLTGAMTAGVVMNLIFKNNWGRWRPRDTVFFEGGHEFYAVLDPSWLMDPSTIGNGDSFPAGHPSAFTVYILVFFIFKHPEAIARILGPFKEWKIKFCRIIKWGSLIISITGGMLMGFARVVAGMHFASDTLWNFAITYSISVFFYYVVFRWPKYEREHLPKYFI